MFDKLFKKQQPIPWYDQDVYLRLPEGETACIVWDQGSATILVTINRVDKMLMISTNRGTYLNRILLNINLDGLTS